ncbi:MAG TPA: hypothetical protein EYM83_08145 [Nitrospirales bacterium]|nr:hypothetical protein [Nitrospirales bacterium]
MMKRCLRGVLLFACLLFPIEASAQIFSNIYIFGNSLSDTGNFATVAGEFPAPFFENRVSNGQVAVEVLATSLGLSADASRHLVGPAVGTNYAVAGARAAGLDPIDLSAQIDAFLLNNEDIAPSDALYVVAIGGNDVRDARDEPDNEISKQIIRGAVDGIEESIRALVSAGAKAILVENVPDIGTIPETRILAATLNDQGVIQRGTKRTERFNRQLSKSVGNIEGDLGVDLVDFNLFLFSQSVITNGNGLGFTNTQDPCFSQATGTFHMECNVGANFDHFIFFDEIHPTAKANQRIGRALFALVPDLN